MQQPYIDTGFIVVPHLSDGVKREEFIKSCFNKQMFAVQNSRGVYISTVFCCEHLLNDLEFPKDDKEFGSQVLLNYISSSDSWFIVGIIAKYGMSKYRNEDGMSYKKDSKDGTSLGWTGNVIWQTLKLFVNGTLEKASKILISVLGSKESILSLNCSGWTIIKSSEGIKLINKSKEIRLDEEAITISFNEDQNLQFKENILVYKDTKNTLTLDKEKGLDYKLGDDINFKIDESQCLFTNGTQKFVIKSDGYNLGNINFEKFITKILNFLNQNAQLLTSTGPSSVGFQTGPAAAPKLQQLIQEIGQIDS